MPPESCTRLANPLGRPTPGMVILIVLGVDVKDLGLVVGCDELAPGELAKPVLDLEDGVSGVGRGLFLCSERDEMIRH